MKPWQKGYELDYLLSIQDKFKDFNSYSMSPFSEIKKHTIADYLEKKTIVIDKDVHLVTKVSKVAGDITSYLNNVLARREKGDRVVDAYAYENVDNFIKKLQEFTEPTWFWAWIDDKETNNALILSGFKFVGTKITTFSELRGLYFRDAQNAMLPREHKAIDPYTLIDICELSLGKRSVGDVVNFVEFSERTFTNHYSNYNKKKAWSAMSFRGYKNDSSFITKPSEMNDKWLEEHKDEHFELQDTDLMAAFPQIRDLYSDIPGYENVHRVRLMRLAPGGGELQRHTDQVDKDSGLTIGALARVHIPIITNSQVIFTTWDHLGNKHETNMKEGEAWVLNTCYPHMAVNGGNQERIHLVIDLPTTKELQELFIWPPK